MAINVGSTELCTAGDIVIGSTSAQAVNVGSTEVFPCGGAPAAKCLTFGEGTEMFIPFGDAGYTAPGTCGQWYLQFEYWADSTQRVAGRVDIFQEYPASDGTAKQMFGLSEYPTNVSNPCNYDFSDTQNFEPGTFNNTQSAFERWTFVKFDCVPTNKLFLYWENAEAPGSPIGYTNPFSGSGLLWWGATPSLRFGGHPRKGGVGSYYNGKIRNITLQSEGVVLGQWLHEPLTAEDIALGRIPDTSGNGNHGTFSLGTGSLEDCV
jgi:hypothetical protein